MTDTLPIIRLLPKTDPRRIRHGFPWVYDNELVIDRRTKGLAPGQLAQLQDANRVPMAVVGVNPNSKLFGRVLDLNPEGVIDAAWLQSRVQAAFASRNQMYDAPFYRLIHAEADGLPGLIVDRFEDTLVVQPNAAWIDTLREDLVAVLQSVTGCTCVIVNGTGRARTLEGLETGRWVVAGDAPKAAVHVPMNGATYLADLAEGQKTGLFFDQRPNHAFAQKFAKDATVLDVFSHVGGFGLAAMAAGAKHVTAVDGSAEALELATQGAALQNRAEDFATIKSDAFAALTNLAEEGRTFDLVICDPPAFAPGKKALEAGLRAYEKIARQAAGLVAPDGVLVLCSCSGAATVEKFRQSSVRGIGRAGRQAQLMHMGSAGPDHPQHVMLPDSGYLKSLFFRMRG